jgi:hypothetical protein
MFTEQRRTKKVIVKTLNFTALGLAILFAGAQFIRPARVNPPIMPGQSIEHHVALTPEVASILKRSCDDCHSNRTEWPLYSNIAPVSWFVTDHVKDGRRHLNFSEWGKLDDEDAEWALNAICKFSKGGAMPLDSYTLMHRTARLSTADVKTLCDWSAAEQRRIAARRPISRPIN